MVKPTLAQKKRVAHVAKFEVRMWSLAILIPHL